MAIPDKLVAFDLGSTRFGWAVWCRSPNGYVLRANGTWILTQGNDRPGARWLRLLRRLESLAKSYGRFDEVVYEIVRRHEGVKAAHRYGGAQAVVEMWARRWGYPLRTVEVAQIKMAATGKGGGRGTGKDVVLATARRRWPSLHFTEDSADAAFIGLARIQEVRPD